MEETGLEARVALLEEAVAQLNSQAGLRPVGAQIHLTDVYRSVDLTPDFALHTAGAVVIPSLTSPTLDVCSRVAGFPMSCMTGRAPVTALHPSVHQGQCWPMKGNTGHLGVALARPIYITNVTIEHVHFKAAIDASSSPKDMELWGMIDGVENVAKFEAWRRRKLAAGHPFNTDPGDLIKFPQRTQQIRLSSFTFDAQADQNIQTFPLDEVLMDLEVDFGIVVLLIKNNWGNSWQTCLYRFRVHGQQI